MKYSSYFSFSFTTPFQVTLWGEEGEEVREFKGFFIKLSVEDDLVYLSRSDESNPAFEKRSTHQLICDVSFPLEKVKSWHIGGKTWILKDYSLLQGLYFLKLSPKGVS